MQVMMLLFKRMNCAAIGTRVLLKLSSRPAQWFRRAKPLASGGTCFVLLARKQQVPRLRKASLCSTRDDSFWVWRKGQ